MSVKKSTQPAAPQAPGTLTQLRAATKNDTQGEASAIEAPQPNGLDHALNEPVEAELIGEVVQATPDVPNLARMAQEAARGAVAARTADGRELAERQHPAMAIAATWLAAHSVPGNETDWVIGEIVGQVLNAETPEEVLADSQVMGLRDMLGRPFTLHEVKFQKSDFEAGHPYYAVLSIARIDDGWVGLVTIGSNTIIAQVMRLVQLGALPRDVVCINARKSPSASGNMPLKLIDYKGPRSQVVTPAGQGDAGHEATRYPSQPGF